MWDIGKIYKRERSIFFSLSYDRKGNDTFLGEHIKSVILHSWVDCDKSISLSFMCKIYVKIAFKYTVKLWVIQG